MSIPYIRVVQCCDSHVKKMGDYLDYGMVAKKAYIYFGSINRSVELRKREDFNLT